MTETQKLISETPETKINEKPAEEPRTGSTEFEADISNFEHE